MNTPVFQSFIMGGYECADHINRSGNRINLLRETHHDIRVMNDYEQLSALNITVVREGICWSLVEISPYVFDFTEVKNRIDAAVKYGIQQIWDICHFGYPDDIYPTHPHFCDRYVALCEAFAQFYAAYSKQPLLVIPINEISFLSWHSGDVRGTVPFLVNSGFDIKYHLCKAAILGIHKLKTISPDCKIILVEPLIKIHVDMEINITHVAELNEHQFQAMDILMGELCPELGGSPDIIDILGFNYYWNCQWEHQVGPLLWPEVEKRRCEISDLLEMAYKRYHKPIFLSETGHFGVGREQWIKEIIDGCILAILKGVDLLGMCIYPVIDRPDWDNITQYCNCGIWDLDENKNRIPHLPSIRAIQYSYAQLEKIISPHSELLSS